MSVDVWELWFPVIVNLVISVCFYALADRLIPRISLTFVKANLYGVDMNKATTEKIPEALGVVIGCLFLIAMFLFIPVPFGNILMEHSSFPYEELVKFVVALLSICCTLLLGFADDVLDLRWRDKLLLPTIASLPLLLVYYVSYNVTTVVVPKPFRPWLGLSVNLGLLYYVYMGCLAVFCTNAINILAGVNGLEAGQSLVIALSVALFNLIEMSGDCWRAHQFSLYFIVPFIFVTLALLKHNWYPSRVFVGDTFCYFAGMTFAVVAILGHFGKTVLLFFIPQVFNFIYSVPQLFHFVPCPRHRMPRLNKRTGLLEPSRVQMKNDELRPFGWLALNVFNLLGMSEYSTTKDEFSTNNLTLINLVLIRLGPMHEAKLTRVLLTIQVMSSGLAFLIRYPLASLFYDQTS